MPPVTVTYKDTWVTTVTINGAVITTSAGYTTSTVITLPPITTKTISVSNVVWSPPAQGTQTSSSSGAAAVIWITQAQTRSTGPPVVWTYRPGPYPTPPSNGPWPPLPPPPPPPPGFAPSVTIKVGPPQPTCRPGQICGVPCLLNYGRPGCLGICGCIGIFCPNGNCVGAGCIDSGGGPGHTDPNTCREKQTASHCIKSCSVLAYPASRTTTCKDPDCTRTITAYTATDSTNLFPLSTHSTPNLTPQLHKPVHTIQHTLLKLNPLPPQQPPRLPRIKPPCHIRIRLVRIPFLNRPPPLRIPLPQHIRHRLRGYR